MKINPGFLIFSAGMIETYLSWIEAEIKKLRFGSEPRSLYEPLRYIMGIGGKRIRPMLALLSYSLFRKDTERIVPFAVALEVFHNFTLLHDDIMDNAPLRRGKPTVHVKWGINTAILSGDVMQVKAYDILLGIDGSKLKEVIRAYNQCATLVCEGQQWDMEFERRSRVTQAEYLKMIRLKTAVLLGFSLELGAILAGAPENDKNALREFGINIGTGFQLKDDLLDVYGDKKKFGKRVGGDIIANKKTFLLITALSKAKGTDKKQLALWLRKKSFNKNQKVSAVKKIYDSIGVPRLTESKINYYFNSAEACLQRLTTPDKAELALFSRQLFERQT